MIVYHSIKKMKKIVIIRLVFFVVLSLVFVACSNDKTSPSKTDETKMASDQQIAENNQLTKERLRRFDSLDFQFYSNQQWDSLAISHDANINVYYPDGSNSYFSVG